MSAFHGKIDEIKYIAVDDFQPYNYSAEAYFVSHIHSDHIRGIKDRTFHDNLKSNGYFVYTSEITAIMLKNRCPQLTPYLKILEITRQTLITLKDGSLLGIRTLPAGHCPGSVMFLFEINSKRILYTGDIRLEHNEIQHLKNLHDFLNKPIEIDSMYFDSTFFLQNYRWFPTREESISKICKEIDTWLKKSDQHNVHIKLTAAFSIECVFIEIYKRLKLQIFMNRYNYESIYKYIPEMDNIVIFDPSKARIHAAIGGTKYLQTDQNKNTLVLIPSALYWTNKIFHETNNEIINKDGNTIRICYSSHCSYTELLHIIKYLKPKKLIPCVIPKELQNQKELEDFIDEYNTFGVDVLDKNIDIPQVEKQTKENILEESFVDDENEVLTFRRRSSSTDSVDLYLKSCPKNRRLQ